MQEKAFSKEIKVLRAAKRNDKCNSYNRDQLKRRNMHLKRTVSLHKLDPFLDDQDILRVGGRIKYLGAPYIVKHPAVLPEKNLVTSLIIRHCHERSGH